MPDTFVHIKGIKNDAFRDEPNPEFYSQKFVVHHESAEDLKQVINGVIREIWTMQGMIVSKDEHNKKAQDDFNNIAFIPIHRIARIEFEIKPIVGQYPASSEGATKQ